MDVLTLLGKSMVISLKFTSTVASQNSKKMSMHNSISKNTDETGFCNIDVSLWCTERRHICYRVRATVRTSIREMYFQWRQSMVFSKHIHGVLIYEYFECKHVTNSLIIRVHQNQWKSIKTARNRASSVFSLMPLWIEIFLEFCEATVDVNFWKMTLLFPNKVSMSINRGAV